MIWTREQIEKLQIGDVLELCLSSQHGVPTPDARWGFQGPIDEIVCRKNDINGKLFILFYVSWGSNNGRMSGSIKEGEQMYRFVYQPGQHDPTLTTEGGQQ